MHLSMVPVGIILAIYPVMMRSISKSAKAKTPAKSKSPLAGGLLKGAYLSNQKTGRNHILKHGTRTVGRKKTEILVVGDPLVSREHCQFHMQDMGLCYVEDLGSTNKTFVNSSPIPAYSLVLLQEGDVVQVGKQLFSFHRGSPRNAKKKKQLENPFQKIMEVFQRLNFLTRH